MKEDLIELKAKIIKIHKGDNFEVETETGSYAICKPSGKIRQCKIKLVVGDSVKIQLSLYDLSKGRIVYRERN